MTVIKRLDFHKAKNAHYHVKSDETRLKLKKCSKEYKAAINKAYTDYTFQAENNLRNAANTEPKELWKILNNLNNCTKKENDLNIDELYEYLKNLNEDTCIYDSDGDTENFVLPNCDDELVNEILNGEICESEILTAVKNLKNSKLPGYDNVINDYIKTTYNLLMPLF